MKPIISVIVTCYNQEKTLSRTLDSILNQKCNFEYEIIICDDSSSDNSRNICVDYKKHHEKINLVFQDFNLGVGANWAIGVQKAKGSYICTCAADDFWHNANKLQIQADYMDQNPDCGLLYTDYDVLKIGKNRIIKNKLLKSKVVCWQGDNLMHKVFSGEVPILTLTTCFRISLFRKYIPADDYIKFRFPLEDWPTWLILSKYTTVKFLQISTGTYTIGHESISRPLQFINAEQKFEKEHKMYKYLCDRFPYDLIYDQRDYRIFTNSNLLHLAFARKNYSFARKYNSQLVKDGHKSFEMGMVRNKFLFYLLISTRLIKHKLIDLFS